MLYGKVFDHRDVLKHTNNPKGDWARACECLGGTAVNILILNLRDHKHPSAGGAQRFTHEVAKRWVSEGHTVSLIASHFAGSARTEIVDGINTIRIGNYVTVRSRARRYYKEHFRGECDVVIDEYTLIPFLAPTYVHEPVIFLVFEVIGEKHITVLPPGVGHVIYHLVEPRWYSRYHDTPTVTISASTKRDLSALGIKTIHEVPIGIDNNALERIPAKEKRPTLLFVGLLKKATRVDHAIRAFRLIQADLPDAQLWVVGAVQN